MSILRTLYYSFTPSMRLMARRIYYFPVDLYDTILHKRENMIPPKGMVFIGSGDFKKQGLHLMDLLIKHAGLSPEGRVLDIGCGIGRLAVPLTGYLNEKGSYEGFDIVKKGIDWCNKHISSHYPNFKFLHIDLKNDLYNLKTDAEAKHFVFPYEDKQFDCIVLTSVFTHMMPEDVDNYLGQIARVMKPAGKCLATFFLLNPDIERQMSEGKAKFNFCHRYEGYSLMDEKVKEANIAFDESYLSAMLDKHGLKTEAIHHGGWSGTETAPLDFQDVTILTIK
ncbi:class I SAM-dependent methyltransferase [Parabacteroides bouchesdurhonensis]|uniref:class I SAM-dependent methyltransferase n=1 Tax=Parabacteroides bouchesdurhonensis TaxID=1936995 RepID=UPI000C859BFD|nr:class I SAM-dependent methyltransferase [Parabacteroides bouchesdurhonensis]